MPSIIPSDHSLRRELNDEVHTRPYEALYPPERMSYIALSIDEEEREREWEHLAALCRRYNLDPPSRKIKHLRLDFGAFRLKFEQHQEFTHYAFVTHGKVEDPFSDPATNLVPQDWLASLPGRTLAAAHIAIVPEKDAPGMDEIARLFDPATLAGSKVERNESLAFTDFRIREDGFSRILFVDRSNFPAQTGRLVLRLSEIEAYRMLALMALPEARRMISELSSADSQLTQIANAIARGSDKSDEDLLEELSRFAARVESLTSSTYYRFAATRAYFALVASRMNDLREAPIEGIPTLGRFLNRRLEPARDTCESAGRWLDLISTRVTQASHLLRTRIDVKREQQNQDLLSTMNRRFQLQLHLQQTVSRLTIAVFTYYSVNLVGFVAQALDKKFRISLDPLAIKAASIPFVILFAYYFIGRKIRHAIMDSEILK